MTASYQFDVEDVEYLRHGDKPLLARLYKPRGSGPFPAVIQIHGGAWNNKDRTADRTTHEALAQAGMVVIALDFRQGAEGAYPLALADINYGVRWVKAHAGKLNIRADRVGICGQSSGGHLAMLTAMRPRDPRYVAIPMKDAPELDASVHCTGLFWPVINPPGRYRMAKELGKQPNPPKMALSLPKSHETFWKSVEAMTEGSALDILLRGEKVQMPPTLWIQPKVDRAHVYVDPGSSTPGTDVEKFAAAYRRAGGDIDLAWYDAPAHFTEDHADTNLAQQAFERLTDFMLRHIGIKALAE